MPTAAADAAHSFMKPRRASRSLVSTGIRDMH
jgi:hypothetical protein